MKPWDCDCCLFYATSEYEEFLLGFIFLKRECNVSKLVVDSRRAIREKEMPDAQFIVESQG